MDKRAKKAIAKNRVKLLGLDYFDLTAPLLAAELLPSKKHKEIKTEASTDKARIDLLLEWIDESAPLDAFQPFLQGIRNCQENVLAKKIKKEAADGGLEIPQIPKKANNNNSLPMTGVPITFPSSTGTSISVVSKTVKPPKPKQPKKPKEEKPEISGLGTLTLPFNGLGALLPPTIGLGSTTPQAQARKRKSGADKPKTPKTPGNQNEPPKANEDIKTVTPKVEPGTGTSTTTTKPAAKKPQGVKVKLPRITRKSSTDKGDEVPEVKKSKTPKKQMEVAGPSSSTTTMAAAASEGPKSPKATGKAKHMSFKDVEIKQIDCRQKFRFKNNDATVKVVHFKDKTDISYLGCPYEDNGKLCEKKVELKSKEFICDSRHKSPNCKQIPRLYITFNDGTADLQLTLLKRNVEILCAKSAAELGALSINEIKDIVDTTIGKKYVVEVHCEKAKKTAKKSVPKWNNLATICDDGSPSKKKRKVN